MARCTQRTLQNSNMHRCRLALDKNTTIEILNQHVAADVKRAAADFVKTPRPDQTCKYAAANLRCAVAPSSP